MAHGPMMFSWRDSHFCLLLILPSVQPSLEVVYFWCDQYLNWIAPNGSSKWLAPIRLWGGFTFVGGTHREFAPWSNKVVSLFAPDWILYKWPIFFADCSWLNFLVDKHYLQIKLLLRNGNYNAMIMQVLQLKRKLYWYIVDKCLFRYMKCEMMWCQ